MVDDNPHVELDRISSPIYSKLINWVQHKVVPNTSSMNVPLVEFRETVYTLSPDRCSENQLQYLQLIASNLGYLRLLLPTLCCYLIFRSKISTRCNELNDLVNITQPSATPSTPPPLHDQKPPAEDCKLGIGFFFTKCVWKCPEKYIMSVSLMFRSIICNSMIWYNTTYIVMLYIILKHL